MTGTTERIVREYPQPIAWAVVNIERHQEPQARLDLALTGFAETTRYLALVAMAHYLDLTARDPATRDERFESRAGGLLSNSVGHWLDLLRSTDRVLTEADVAWLTPGLQTRQVCPAWTDLWQFCGKGNKQKLRALDLLDLVVEIRNRKAHPSTHLDTAELSKRIYHALIAWLDQLGCLAARPPIRVEWVKKVGRDRVRICMVHLVGTGMRGPTMVDVDDTGEVWEGVFLWDTEGEAIDFAPLGRVTEGTQELATLVEMRGGEPVYLAANPNVGHRTGERPLDEFRQRAPFLLETGTARAGPSNERALTMYQRRFRDYLLDDGKISDKEEVALGDMAELAGLSEAETTAVRSKVESDPDVQRRLAALEADAQPATAPPDTWPEAAHALLHEVRAEVLSRLPFEPVDVTASEELDDVGNNDGELYFQATRVQGVSVWFTGKRAPRVTVVVGFYSENEVRDPVYRKARAAILESCDLEPVDGWKLICPEWKTLALEAYGGKPITDLARPETVAEVSRVALTLAGYVAAHLDGVEPRPGGG